MFRTRIGEDRELALIEHRHARELFALIETNRAHLREWMSWVDQRRTPAEVANYISLCLKQFALGQGLQVGVWETGNLCGIINCCPIDWPNKASYLEYWLGESYQGRGLMTPSLQAVVDHLFGTLDLHRLTIRCATDNVRSRAVAERLGFAFEGVSRDAEWLYDHFVNHAVYGLIKGDKVTTSTESGANSAGANA
jgi:ribosomal-protein-serine acetyltransferase